MTGGKGLNIPASVKARLLTVANARQIDFQLLLNRYAIERFLYRLSLSNERENFVLKGAMLLALPRYLSDVSRNACPYPARLLA